MLKLYNTLTRKKENFKPIKKTIVSIYECGPTCYSYQHIGNLRRYIFGDILTRTLLYNKFKVKRVMNVTDVGHLTSDSDTGNDKVEEAAKKEKKSPEEIVNYYLKIFKEDFKKLNIIEPNIWAKATENIQEQIELIKILEKKGYTYKTSDGIYFNTSKLKDYGKLARLKKEGLEAGKRVEMGEKKNKTDFALWKFSKNEKRLQEWNSPWGKGFPGWHLECSAISSKYLGKQFDIHTGGEDHIQIHHTNEIAQSESAYGKKPWVRYWMHSAFLTFKGEKVSKSKGGLYTISELEKQGFDPLDFRYLCLTTKYRMPLSFNLESLKTAKHSYDNLKKIVLEVKKSKTSKGSTKDYKKRLLDAINDDLNTPIVLALLWILLKDKKLGSKQKIELVKEFDKILALDLKEIKVVKIPKEITELAKKRQKARKNKDWKLSDKIRDQINKKGYLIEDVEKGYRIKKK